MLLLLGACDEARTSDGLLANLTPPTDAALPTVPLAQAWMMRGDVILLPPSGYCIDPDSLTQSFALMARCDTLGSPQGVTGAPVGVLTVSFARSSEMPSLPTASDLAAASNLGTPMDTRATDTSVVFQTTGPPPSDELSSTHWRSVAHVGRFTMGAALFGPEGRRAVSREGARMLEEMIKRTTDKTNAG